MTTLTTPDVDLEQIAHLDHTPTCGVSVPTGRRMTDRAKCGAEASWWIQANHHCIAGHITNGFLCQRHHDRLTSGIRFGCADCREFYHPLPLITRMERIR